MIQVLFPLGVRLSTIVTAGAFVGLATARRDPKPLLAGFAWLAGFEAVFQVASLIVGKLPLGLFSPIFFIALGTVVLTFAYRSGIHADWRFLAPALALVAVWLATGFHLNGHQHGMFSLHPRISHFDPAAEFLNDAAKTLWALAYLVPLRSWKRGTARRKLRHLPSRVSGSQSTGRASGSESPAMR
jgi:hypothetical protein